MDGWNSKTRSLRLLRTHLVGLSCGRSIVRSFFGILLLVSLGAADVRAGLQIADSKEEQVSVWRASGSAADPAMSESDLQSDPADGNQTPILVPLPAPLIGAASGLLIVFLLRKRVIRG